MEYSSIAVPTSCRDKFLDYLVGSNSLYKASSNSQLAAQAPGSNENQLLLSIVLDHSSFENLQFNLIQKLGINVKRGKC